MGKSKQAFRTIREVADWLGVATHVLRFWESKFPQVRPVKRAGGRRYYRPTDVAIVGGIKVLLHDQGLTIRGVQKMFREQGAEAIAALAPQMDGLLDDDALLEADAAAWARDAELETEAQDGVDDSQLGLPFGDDAPIATVTPLVPTAVSTSTPPEEDAEPPAQTVEMSQTMPDPTEAEAEAEAEATNKAVDGQAAHPPGPAALPDPLPLTPRLAALSALVDRRSAVQASQRATVQDALSALSSLRDRMRASPSV